MVLDSSNKIICAKSLRPKWLKKNQFMMLLSHLATIDLFGQNANVLDGSSFREAIKWSVEIKRLHELHVTYGVNDHRHDSIHD